MTRDLFFGAAEKTSALKTFVQAQRLVAAHFKLCQSDCSLFPYDVRTREQLEHHEVKDGVFAYLCRYAHGSGGRHGHGRPDPHFFRVCLQDSRILEALTRGGSFIRFIPLMFYIATHELVHILRFSRGECDFDMPLEKRVIEEEKVDEVTRSILKPMKDPGLDLVIDCFGDRYLLA